MEQIIFCSLIWLAVFIIIPFDRIKELSTVALTAFVWMIFVDNISSYLGYYTYKNSLLAIGKAPVFQNLAEAGLGIVMINWLKEDSLMKLLEVITVGMSFVALHYIYSRTGTFVYGSFDPIMNLIHHIAALSIFIWLSLSIVGEQKAYSGNRSRFKR